MCKFNHNVKDEGSKKTIKGMHFLKTLNNFFLLLNKKGGTLK